MFQKFFKNKITKNTEVGPTSVFPTKTWETQIFINENVLNTLSSLIKRVEKLEELYNKKEQKSLT